MGTYNELLRPHTYADGAPTEPKDLSFNNSSGWWEKTTTCFLLTVITIRLCQSSIVTSIIWLMWYSDSTLSTPPTLYPIYDDGQSQPRTYDRNILPNCSVWVMSCFFFKINFFLYLLFFKSLPRARGKHTLATELIFSISRWETTSELKYNEKLYRFPQLLGIFII